MGSNHKKVLKTLEELHSLVLSIMRRNDNVASLIIVADQDKSHSQAQKQAIAKDPFPIVALLFPEEKPPVPSLQLKWVGLYKVRYEMLIDRIRRFNDELVGLVDISARVAIRELTWENNTMILTLYNKTVDLVNLTKALTHGTSTWTMDTSPITSRYFDVEQKCDLLGLAQFKRIITTVENSIYFTPQSAGSLELKGEELAEIRTARSDIQVFSFLDDTSDRCAGE